MHLGQVKGQIALCTIKTQEIAFRSSKDQGQIACYAQFSLQNISTVQCTWVQF